MDFQFYPTPKSLANRAWGKFKNKNFVRVLEPSAGNGDLALAGLEVTGDHRYYRRSITIDCCEFDVSKHHILSGKGLNVVGIDFLKHADGAIYSHILMNPPFLEGAKHVLKAWDILWDGEIVAIINAETIRNPFSGERRQIVNLIEKFGEVEFIEGAFSGDDVERRTDVEVALVYLRKTADIQTDITGNLFDNLDVDSITKERLASGFDEYQMPALPTSEVENTVVTFNAAVRASRDSVFAQARSRYYSALLGETMAARNNDSENSNTSSIGWVQAEIATNYLKLKDRAWSSILRSSKVTAHLSSSAQKRLESEFDKIKNLEFTAANIYGFLCGLMEKQGEIQIGMACDVFDLFTSYHNENTVFYKGWKSNNKHRSCGMRLRTTRMVLPRNKSSSYQASVGYETERMLADFDKVFAMLDLKRKPDVSLVDIFRSEYKNLCNGARVTSSYFDVRYYPGVGTIHFFARDKALIDRLNRLVGRHRQWLPQDDDCVSKDFWIQYEGAEKLDKEFRAEINKQAPKYHYGWSGPLGVIANGPREHDDGNYAKAEQLANDAASVVLDRHGINIDFMIENTEQGTLLLTT
jgi:hypothetical protein